MIFWPYHKYKLTSKLSSEQLKQKFSGAPQFQWSDAPDIRTMIFANQDNTYRYRCDLYRKYLKIADNDVREFGRQKGIKTEAKISFKDSDCETSYTIKIRLSLGVKLFLIFVITGISIGYIIAVSNDAKEGKLTISSFIPMALLILFYVQLIYGFSEQKARLELFIYDLLEDRV